MKTITINGNQHQIPSAWNELAHDSLMFLATQSAKGILVTELKTKMILHLLGTYIYPGINTKESGYLYRVHIGKQVYNLSVEDIYNLTQHTDFLFETQKVKENGEDVERTFIRPYLYKCPYKELPCGCSRTLTNPGDMLTNLTFEEAKYLQTIHANMRGDFWDNINKLLGILFRDHTKEFNPEHLNNYANDVSKASNNVKMIAYWFYVGSLNYLENKFTTVFSKTGEGKKVGHVFDQQMELTVELADKDVVKIKDVNKTLYWDVLYTLEKSNKDAQEAQRDMKKMRKKK